MKKFYSLGLLLILFFTSFKVLSTNYYVNPNNGNDGNNGTNANSPFRSLSRIDGIHLRPGDTVFFMGGTYTRPGQTLLTINESGTAQNPITFTNYQNDTPVFEFDSWTGIDVIGGASYLVFDGLTIKGARTRVNLNNAINQPGGCAANLQGNPQGIYNGTGLLVVGPNLTWSNSATRSVPHHITVNNCEIFDCTSSGVAFQQADYVTVTNNRIYNNCWYTTYGTSGVNFYQFVNTDRSTGFHNTVTNNLLYGNQLRVPQIAGGCAFHDGNGFIIDDFNHIQTGNYRDINAGYDAYTAKTLIANNVSVENGGSGLHFFLSSNCYIYNNTVANNAFQNNGNNSNGELRIGNCSNFEVKNNIIKSEYTVHNTSGNSNIDYTHNYQFGPDIDNGLANCQGCIRNVDIDFLNTNVNNSQPYITAFGSVVTNAGTTVNQVTNDYVYGPRPFSNAYDIGAYELIGNTNSGGSSLVRIIKRNAAYAVHSSGAGSNGQNVTLWQSSSSSSNLNWVEIDRGNGYYSYQKEGANFCIDGGNGGANGQNIHLWTCNANNQNQQWQKVNAGGGAVRLVKRNASGFAINGGNSGALGQNIDLFDASNTSQNLQWFITPIGGQSSAKSLEENSLFTDDVATTANSTIIQEAVNTAISIYDVHIFSLDGNLIETTSSTSASTENIDLNYLDSGIYIIEMINTVTGERTVEKIGK